MRAQKTKRVITIDGPSGAGKSTIARALAEVLGFSYLDTGALYRAVALYLRERGLTEEATDSEIESILKGLSVSFRDGRVYINDRDVSPFIRTPEVGHYASVFSTRAPVRRFLLGSQRSAAETSDIVAEGRDMGTVVFPDAWRKFFLTASEEERARRRYKQLRDIGRDITFEEALMDVRERDRRDSERQLAPLRPPRDSIIIDSTGRDVNETLREFLRHI